MPIPGIQMPASLFARFFFRHVEGLHFTWAALTKRRSGIVVRIVWTRRAAPSLVVISAYAMNRISIAITDLNSLPITIRYPIFHMIQR